MICYLPTSKLIGDENIATCHHMINSNLLNVETSRCLFFMFCLKVAKETEDILAKGGFSIKCWQFSGESCPRVSQEDVLNKGTGQSKEQVIMLKVVLNFSSKKRGVRMGLNLKEADLPSGLPNFLTRQIALEQVMKIYDPLGLISPITLWAKIYLQETWACKLGWDDPLPADFGNKWCNFFSALFKLPPAIQFLRFKTQ